MGIVILANKNSPIDDRITVAYQIFSKLGAVMPPSSGVKVRGRAGVQPYDSSNSASRSARRDRSSAIKSLMPIQFTWQILLSPGG
jgi:hypothetical protein